MESYHETAAAIVGLLLVKKMRKREKDPHGYNFAWVGELV